MDQPKMEIKVNEPPGSQNSQQPQLQPQPQPPTQPQPQLEQAPEVQPQQRQGVPVVIYKGRLQEFTHRVSIPNPVYHSTNEGAVHQPKFRCTVVVDGKSYTTQNTFLHKKSAEQEAAKLALEGIINNLGEEGCRILAKDTGFCKSTLYEFAVKMKLQIPKYTTIQTTGLLIFVSSLVFEGVTYTGEAGKTKKEAEQLAARAAIISILGSSSARLILYEIVRSRYKKYVALHQGEDAKNTVGCEGSNIGNGLSVSEPSADKELDGAEGASNVQPTATFGQSSEQGVHLFKKQKIEPVSETPILPITFVPSCPVESSPNSSVPVDPPKRKKKNKKKNKKIANMIEDKNIQMPVAALPQIHPCPTTQ